MSSTSGYSELESRYQSSEVESIPLTPRKRRRCESGDHHFQAKYNDAYRILYNEHVESAAARIESDPRDIELLHATQIGASTWSSQEKALLFAALARLGKDDTPGIARAVATKSILEIRELLLLLHDAAAKQGNVNVTLRDIPAAIELGEEYTQHLDALAEALATYQERYEAKEEQAKYGDYWLLTSQIASEIQDALTSDRSRASSSAPPSGSGGSRRAYRTAPGACTFCKLHKQRCDRATPCSTCVRRKLEPCVYPTPSVKQEPLERIAKEATPTNGEGVLKSIPEAELLCADNMLTLSRNLFMNRSPTIPSPWPHWSEIVTDLAEEPAIYRSAFNDFHTLAVSVTKRLVLAAITQATSRLRSQRRRTKKGVNPLVKRRDVLTAIDIVGMKRNGHERWRGVARRCAVLVFQGVSRNDTGRRSKTQVPWDDVEKIMAPDDLYTTPFANDTEVSDSSSTSFRHRAVRSGTPLPLESLTLSDSHDESNMEHSSDESDIATLDDSPQASTRQSTQPRDFFGRYTSAPLTADQRACDVKHQTIEQFDQESSRQEEHTLWESLKLHAPVKDEQGSDHDNADETSLESTEKIITDADDWRLWTDYRPEWEEFEKLVPCGKFTVNKPPEPVPRTFSHDNLFPGQHLTQNKRKPAKGTEPRIQDPRAYADHQAQAARLAEDDEDDEEDESSLVDLEHENLTAPIEDSDEPHRSQYREESMDWDTYADL